MFYNTYIRIPTGIDVDVDIESGDKTQDTGDQNKQNDSEGRGRCHGRGGRGLGGRGGRSCPRGPGSQCPNYGPWGMWDWGMGGQCPPWMMGKCGEKEKEKAKKKGKGKNKGEADQETPKEQQPSTPNMETDAPKSFEKRAPSPVNMVGYLFYCYQLNYSYSRIH